MSEEDILALVDKKDYKSAKDLILIELHNNPENIELKKLLGLCNINLDCFDEALENFNDLIEKNPQDATSLFYAANILYQYGNFDDAELLLTRVIKLREEYIDAYKTLIMVYLKTKKFDKLFELGQKILQKVDNDTQVYDVLAAAAMENAGFDLAVDYLKRAVELDPNNSNFITKLGIAYFAAGKVTVAIDCYKKSLSYSPCNAQTLYHLGLSYYAIEEYKLAFETFKQCYDLGFDTCLNAYALSAYKVGDWEQGINLYNKLIELYPEKEGYQYNLACCYDADNNLNMAANIIEKLLTFNMNSLQLKLHLASLYSRIGRFESAKVMYSDIINSGFIDVNIMYEYAVLCARTGDTDKSEEMLKDIIKMKPEYVLAYKDLAIIYTSRRQFELAEEYFKKAKQIDSSNMYVLFEIANYYHVMADFDKAQKAYNDLLKIKDLPSFMYLAVAKNYISMNLPKKAKKILFELFEKHPNDIDIMYNLAQVLMTENDYETAMQLLESVYTLSPGVEVANMLAKCYLEVGLYDRAYNLYKIASVASPGSITLMLAMADCKYRQKDYSAALKHLSPVLEIFPEHEDAQRLLLAIKNGV